MPCAGEVNEHGVDPTTPEEIERAMALRVDYGLRADEPYVRGVACAPGANLDFGIPLTPAETEELFARTTRWEPVVEVVQRYAADHADEFGGLYVDRSLGGVVTVLWTGNVGQHELAIRSQLEPGTPIVLRQVRWSEKVLSELQDVIAADWDWFAEIAARPSGVGVDTVANVVRIEISSANPDASQLIAAHFRVPIGMIRVESDGTGVDLLPWGTIRGRLEGVPRRVFGELVLLYEGDSGAGCGHGDVGIGVGRDGTFELPCGPGHWIIKAARTVDDVVAQGEVDLEPGGTANVVLRPVARP